MAKQLITIGTPGAGGGDPAHAAFKKINDNATELYNAAIPDTEEKKSQARANLGVGGAAVEDVMPVSKGGTGATTIEAAATVLACIGAGQTWRQKKTQRALNTRYLNTTGRVMLVAIRLEAIATGFGGMRLAMYSGNHLMWQSYFTQSFGTGLLVAVENGQEYGLDLLVGTKPADFSIEDWLELIP